MSKADEIYKRAITAADDFLHEEREEDCPVWCLCSGRLPHLRRCLEYKAALAQEKRESK
jgi:hypothetical protein